MTQPPTTFDLSSVAVNQNKEPPRLFVYGGPGVGKTTFAATAPNPIFIRTEDGLGTLQVPAFPIATTYQQVIDALRALSMQPHTYRTLVIDSLDWLETLIHEHTCTVSNKDSMESWGYGKGYVEAQKYWQRILDGLTNLRAKGMTVVCIAHAEIKRFDAPDTEPYDRYQPKLHKTANAKLQEWADVIGFAHFEVFTQNADAGFGKKIVRGAGTGRRLLSVEERPAFIAKNHYGMPPEIELSWPSLREALAPAFTQPPIDSPNEVAANA